MNELDLIVVVGNKHKEEEILSAANEAGAQGGTVIHGRGTLNPEKMTFLNFLVEPEKEVVLIISKRENTEAIKAKINEKLDLKEPGQGILFVIPIKKAIGHLEV